jgi:3-hydroxymyristoyl/3-hydroxydecanoyl-(acyl carrier protein) dehydratase
MKVNIEKLLPRICVRPPYFAPSNLQLRDGVLSAEVPVEQALASEVLPIAAGEVGRHLAVLGLCSLAIQRPDDGRYYYLARAARYERLCPGSYGEAQSMLLATVSSAMTGKRSGEAQGILTTRAGEPIAKLQVIYNILSEKIFARMFDENCREMRSGARTIDTNANRDVSEHRKNPFKTRYPLADIHFQEGKMNCTLGIVTPESCNGHFPRYPCLPVAFLMSALTESAGILFGHSIGQPGVKYWAKSGEMQADHLAFAGDEIQISAEKMGSEEFVCEAVSNRGQVVGKARMLLGKKS